MNIIEEAFSQLYPNQPYPYTASIKYSRKFSDYNANVRLRENTLIFNLSRKWKEIDRDIRIGLIQELLVKITKKKTQTTNMEFYHNFIKNLHLAIPKDKSHPILEASFHRVNKKYFNNMVEIPNLEFGKTTLRKLGHYSYQKDIIQLSSVLLKGDEEFIDLVMHHEMLHKQLKFYWKPGRAHFHTPEFKKKEREFENFEEIEARLTKFLTKQKIKSWFWG